MTQLEILETMKISRNAPYKQIVSFSQKCNILNYKEGDIIYSKDIGFEYIGIIISGKVAYYFHDANTKKNIKIGSYKKYPLGLFNFLEVKNKSVSVKATEDTQVLAIEYKKLVKMERKAPYFTNQIYKSIIKLNMQIMERLAMIILGIAYKKVK